MYFGKTIRLKRPSDYGAGRLLAEGFAMDGFGGRA